RDGFLGEGLTRSEACQKKRGGKESAHLETPEAGRVVAAAVEQGRISAENWYPRRRSPSRAISRRFAPCDGAGFPDRIQQTGDVLNFGKRAHDVRLEGHHRLAVSGLAGAFGERKGDAASLEGFGLRQLEETAVVIVVFVEPFPAGPVGLLALRKTRCID